MIKKISVAAVFVLMCGMLSAQAGQITVKEDFWRGTLYLKNDIVISKDQVRNDLAIDPENLATFKAGNTQQIWGMVFGGIGGAFIGYPLGTSLGGGDPNWTLAGIGAGAVIIGGVIYGGGKNKIELALNNHNSNLSFWQDHHDKYEKQSIALLPGMIMIKF